MADEDVDLDPVEMGEPIRALADLAVDVPPTLPGRVRSSIQRRLLAADIADLSLSHVLHVFLEFLKVVFEALGGGQEKEEEDE